jgi:exosome complex RNA-binding protein Rrp42 (RNase PH superfamily)
MECSRPDGRRLDQVRDLRISFQALRTTDGSALFGFGACRSLLFL